MYAREDDQIELTGKYVLVSEDEWRNLTQKVDEIHMFCVTVADLMDKMKDNPMLKAMLPPGSY